MNRVGRNQCQRDVLNRRRRSEGICGVNYSSDRQKMESPVSVQAQSKKISNDQEVIQSDPISRPQNQKGNNLIHKLTTVYERHSRQTE